MSFYSIPTLLGALAFFAIGLFVLSKNWRAEVNISFGVLCFILFNWEMSYTVCYSTSNPAIARVFADFACTNIAFSAPALYWLAMTTLGLARERRWVILSLIVIVVQMPLFLLTDLYLQAPHHYFFGYYSHAGPWHPYHLVTWYGILARPFFLITRAFLKARQHSSIEANRIKYLALAYMSVCGCSLDYIPKYGVEYYPFGFGFGLVFAVLIAYGIVRYQLLDIRVGITRTGIFLATYLVVLGVPFAVAWWGGDGLAAALGPRWWAVPFGLCMVLASLGPMAYGRLRRQAEQTILRRLALQELEAATDGLTTLLVRRAFLREAQRLLLQARQQAQPCALLMIDLDHFKEKNDAHGHLVGDAVLREVSTRIKGLLRTGDVVGRYGGEELVACLPVSSHAEALHISERLRASVPSAPIQVDGLQLRQTLSIGLAIFPDHGEDVDTLIAKADAALYAAKRSGRDRVEVAR